MKYEPASDVRNLLRERRGWTSQLLEHVADLDRADQVLIRTIYELGMSATDVAAMVGRQPRTMRKRAARLVRRITSPQFQYVAHFRDQWPPVRRRIAEHVFMRGRSQRDTARAVGVSVHRVRQECDRIKHAIEMFAEQHQRQTA